MKKILTLATAALLTFASCDSKLDIVPLGMTTLETVDDLESDIAAIEANVEGMKTRVEGYSASRSADLAANTNFTVDSYIVGSKTLWVFLNGLKCHRGVDFNEVGTSGQVSTQIKFTDIVKKDVCISWVIF